MSYCHDCGKEFEAGAMLCPECGSRLAEADGTESSSGWSVDDSATDTSTSDWSSTGGTADDRLAETSTVPETDSESTSGHKYHDTDIFEFSLSFPLGQGGQPLVIHSVLAMFSFLVLPLPFFYGYSYRVGRAAARGDDEVPTFDDWGEIGRDGLILLGMNLAVTIGILAVMGAVFVAVTALNESSLLAVLIGGVGSLFVLLCSYVAGAIVPVFIGTGSLSETFSDGRVIDFAFSKYYLKGFVLLLVFAFILSIALNIIGFILLLTIVGVLLFIPLTPLLMAYTCSLTFATWGYIYNEAAEAGDVTPVEPDASLGLE